MHEARAWLGSSVRAQSDHARAVRAQPGRHPAPCTRPQRRPLLQAAASLFAFAALSAPAGAAVGAGSCPGATDIPASDGDSDEAAAATHCLVNAERTSRGLRALRRDAQLAQAARRHSADMVRRDFFAHVSPSGETLKDRVRAAGYGEPGPGLAGGREPRLGHPGAREPERARRRLAREPRAPPHHALERLSRAGGRRRERGTEQGRGPGATYTLNVGAPDPARV